MDRQTSKKGFPIFWVVGAVGVLIVAGLSTPYWPAIGSQAKFLSRLATDGTLRREFSSSVFEVYRLAYRQTVLGINEKVDAIRTAENENFALKLENADLKMSLQTSRFGCREKLAEENTKKYEIKLSGVTGTRVGKALESIAYKPPFRLLPSQLFTLAVSYLKAREDEKAAVILTHLTLSDDSPAFRTSKNYVLAGVAWYRLENYQLANEFFDRALRLPAREGALPYQAQARLWKALVARRMDKPVEVQYWLTDLVDHHPRSLESSWINPQEASRATASE